MHFPDTKSRALTSSTMAQKALPIAAGVVVAAVVSALLNRWLAQKAERRNPPLGRFITVDGVRLHYVDRGTGTPSGPAARQREHDRRLSIQRLD